MEVTSLPSLTECLKDKQLFQALSRQFIAGTIQEAMQRGEDSQYVKLLDVGLRTLADENIELVFRYSESPIETVFLNSLLLCFIRNSMPAIVVPPLKNAPQDLAKFRSDLEQLTKFTTWYESNRREEARFTEYFDEEVSAGRMTQGERPHVERLILFYHWLPFRSAYHLCVQAGFPGVRVSGKGSRVDCLIWVPCRPGLDLVVECDSFQFHLNKDAFGRDRKRDRAFQAAGFEVYRFTGKEIVADPAGSGNELFDVLLSRVDA